MGSFKVGLKVVLFWVFFRRECFLVIVIYSLKAMGVKRVFFLNTMFVRKGWSADEERRTMGV